jgi:rod shape-determining protein MreD
MKRILVLFGLTILGLYLQTLVGFYLPSLDYLRPNLLCILVVFVALHEPTAAGAFLAFFVGTLFDLASGSVIGPWAGAFVLVFGLLSAVTQQLFVQSILTVVAAVFFSSVLGTLSYQLLSFEMVSPSHRSFWGVLVEATVTAAIAPLVFGVLRKFFGRRGRLGAPRILHGA